MSSSEASAKPGTIPIMAAACGVMVGNIYLCQPLLGAIARDFGVPDNAAALVATMTQIGYALGILLLVPLADIAQPRRLVRWLMGLEIIALACAAFAPTLAALLVASVSLALLTIVPQVLIPLATSLAPPEKRGSVVGTLMTGLILGILLSRTISGFVAEYSGTWRASYLAAAALTAILFVSVPRFMPERAAQKISYATLLASLPPLLKHRPLLLSMSMSFLTFGAFSAFWATLAFHLATPAFGLGPAAAGLFGLWGAPGALLAPMAGRLSDKFGPSRVNAFAFIALFASFAVSATFGATSLIAIVLAVNLLDFGAQSGQVANQTRIFGIAPDIRARLNTLYMTATFSGGALGAALGGYAWTLAGWRGVCAVAATLVAAAAFILLASAIVKRYQARRTPLRA